VNARITLLPGDGIGPEVVAAAVRVLEAIGRRFGHSWTLTPKIIGGAALGSVIIATPLSILKELMSQCLALFKAPKGKVQYAELLSMLFQLFNVLNARSDDRSAFVHLFANGWLWTAIGGSVVLQLLVVYVPLLQRAFGTTALSTADWAFCLVVASSVLWLREASKAIPRGTRLRKA